MKIIILLLFVLFFVGCSTFESFHFKLSQEIAYGDAAIQADGAAHIAKIEADARVMEQASAPHTVEVKLPPEMMPAIEIYEVPPEISPGASGTATMIDGTTLYDCVDTKGESIICSRLPGQ